MNEWMNVIFAMSEIKLSIVAHGSYIGEKQCGGAQSHGEDEVWNSVLPLILL